MPLVVAKCTSCGANLEVDNTKDAAICQYCGTPFIIEKAINNFQVTNHITANAVNIYGGNSADFVIRANVLEKYAGSADEVVIPNTVKIIGTKAFKDCIGITNVIIPDSVTEIMSHAFEGCTRLTSITLPNSITKIDNYTFSCCSELTNIIIPDSVTEIGECAFSVCKSLTSITIPNSVTKIGDRAFFFCLKLANVSYPETLPYKPSVFADTPYQRNKAKTLKNGNHNEC